LLNYNAFQVLTLTCSNLAVLDFDFLGDTILKCTVQQPYYFWPFVNCQVHDMVTPGFEPTAHGSSADVTIWHYKLNH
jgi:hypothetical protein